MRLISLIIPRIEPRTSSSVHCPDTDVGATDVHGTEVYPGAYREVYIGWCIAWYIPWVVHSLVHLPTTVGIAWYTSLPPWVYPCYTCHTVGIPVLHLSHRGYSSLFYSSGCGYSSLFYSSGC